MRYNINELEMRRLFESAQIKEKVKYIHSIRHGNTPRFVLHTLQITIPNGGTYNCSFQQDDTCADTNCWRALTEYFDIGSEDDWAAADNFIVDIEKTRSGFITKNQFESYFE